MNYKEIFEEVVSILHHDYAGCIDKKGWDSPDTYRKQLAELDELDAKRFVELVNDYLLDFKDHHMFFVLASANQTKAVDVGFKVRRFEDSLYVYYTGKETRVKKGMRIQSIDQLSIPELAEIHNRQLETAYERQKWEKILTKYKTCKIVDENGLVLNLDLKLFEKEPYVPEFSLKELNNETLIMKITDFFHPNELNELIRENEEKLNQCKHLIIDVRENRGGDDSSYYGLLHYLVDRPGSYVELFDYSGSGMLINCTQRNFETKAKPAIDILDSVTDPSTRKLYEAFIREWNKNLGKGFVEFDFSEFATDIFFEPKGEIENVTVLSDVDCGSSGDSFVEACKRSSKVIVIGRATAGVTDYSNLATKKWEDQFELWYPTSKDKRIDIGNGLTGIGVLPDIHLPWTPEHIFEDIDLKEALLLCEKQ